MDNSKTVIYPMKFEANQLPQFVEKRTAKWILYGEKNDYPDYLLSLFNSSAKHNAILTGKRDLIVGKGFEVDAKGLNTEQLAVISDFVKSVNSFGESLNVVLSKTVLDVEVFGGFYLQITWSKGGTKPAEIIHVDYSKIRTNKEETEFYFSEDWSKVRTEKDTDKYEIIPAFNDKIRKGKQILSFKQYRPNLNVYAIPDYIGCISYIEVDKNIANFHLSNTKNNFWPSLLIQMFNGIPDEEKQADIAKLLKKNFQGTHRAGEPIIGFNDPGNPGIKVDQIAPSELDKQFDLLNKTIQQEIFAGHKVTSPMLFGIKTEGQLGGRSEIIEAAELFQNTYANSRQQEQEGVYNYIASLYGFENRLRIVKSEPIGIVFSEQTLVNVMTKDEIRERAGLPRLEENQPEAQFKLERPQPNIGIFKRYGVPASEYEVLKTKKVLFSSDVDALESESNLYSTGFAVNIPLSAIDKKILAVIKSNPLATIEEIVQAIEVEVDIVESSIKKLTNAGALTEPVKTSGGVERKLTPDGNQIIEETPKRTIDISVKYKYVGPKDDKNRDFCRELLDLDKLFTRKEIQDMSREEGYSVWEMRGGFYHNPKTDITTPYCRHTWEQQIVRKIK